MRKLIILIIFNLISINQLFADSRIIGKWLGDDGSILEFLDGFQVSVGPILITDNDGNVSSGDWKLNNDNSISVTIGWSEDVIEFIDDKNFNWGYSSTFTKTDEKKLLDRITLKDSSNDFINELVNNVWSTTFESQKADFSTTFTNESGVVEFIDSEDKVELSSWSVGSNVLKISSSIIVEAAISSEYFIGLDANDNFIIFKNIGKSSTKQKTTMNEKREEFFDAFLTGSWEVSSYGVPSISKFRPIYGELKGKILETRNNKLTSYSDWEYSPSTGAIKVGYSEYINATVVGEDTLALLDAQGNQYFYYRSLESDGVRYTLADVKQIPLNENSLLKIEKELSGQFQNGEYIYTFEFSDEKRTGFLHEFRSSPYSITGETFYSESMISDSSVLYIIEDFILFDENEVFKRDSSKSRLRVKTETEVLEGVEEENKRITELSTKQLLAIVTLLNGEVLEIPLGIEGLVDVKKIEIVVE